MSIESPPFNTFESNSHLQSNTHQEMQIPALVIPVDAVFHPLLPVVLVPRTAGALSFKVATQVHMT